MHNPKAGRKKIKGNKELLGQMENKCQHCRLKSSHINNHILCKWSKHPNEKTEIRRLDNRARPNYILATKKLTLKMKIQIG